MGDAGRFLYYAASLSRGLKLRLYIGEGGLETTGIAPGLRRQAVFASAMNGSVCFDIRSIGCGMPDTVETRPCLMSGICSAIVCVTIIGLRGRWAFKTVLNYMVCDIRWSGSVRVARQKSRSSGRRTLLTSFSPMHNDPMVCAILY